MPNSDWVADYIICYIIPVLVFVFASHETGFFYVGCSIFFALSRLGKYK